MQLIEIGSVRLAHRVERQLLPLYLRVGDRLLSLTCLSFLLEQLLSQAPRLGAVIIDQRLDKQLVAPVDSCNVSLLLCGESVRLSV